jgi:transcription-repair coupling factor (superfamily II helicase)
VQHLLTATPTGTLQLSLSGVARIWSIIGAPAHRPAGDPHLRQGIRHHHGARGLLREHHRGGYRLSTFRAFLDMPEMEDWLKREVPGGQDFTTAIGKGQMAART